MLIAALVFLAVLAPQLYAAAVWQGNWRRLAAAPLLLMVADILLILVQASIDPTSHNLWPFELATIALIGLPVVGVLWLLRSLVRRSSGT